MTITTSTLHRAGGVCAAVAGALFIAVQIAHPVVELDLVTTTEWRVRSTMKVVLAALGSAGVTAMYLRQVKQAGVLGLVGYVLFAANFLLMFATELIAVAVLPSLAASAPGYVSDVLAAGNGGVVTGDIGVMQLVGKLSAVGYVFGGLVFGIALFRANVLARWAAALLAISTVASLAIPLLPHLNQRLFAVPTGVALIGLGYSLWRQRSTGASQTPSSRVGAQLDPAGAK